MVATILVIDDEESIRFTFERFLSAEGYRVLTAGSYREALERIEIDGIDLIFADIILPDGTGVDLLKEIQTRKPGCPMILMTAYPSSGTKTDLLHLGAFDYVSKPVRQDSVLGFVNLALKGGKVAQGGWGTSGS